MIALLPIDPAAHWSPAATELADSGAADLLLYRLLAVAPESALHWLPVGAALVLGLLLGGALWRSRGDNQVLTSAGSAATNGSSLNSGTASAQGGATGSHDSTPGENLHPFQSLTASRAAEFSGADTTNASGNQRQRLQADLVRATASAERNRIESDAALARAKILNSHLQEQDRYISELSNAVEGALSAEFSPRQRAVAGARAALIQLSGAVRSGRQWLGAASGQFDSLHRRIEAGEQHLWATAEETAGFRQYLEETDDSSTPGSRKTAGVRQQLRQRVTHVDEQMRVYHQHLSGCLSGLEQSRKSLLPDHQHLRTASTALTAAGERLSELAKWEANTDNDTDADRQQRFDDTLAEAVDRVEACRDALRNVDARAIERGSDTLERCHWVATEAPARLLQAVEELGECDGAGDINVSMMLSRSWRKLADAGHRLDSLRSVAESNRVGDYPARALPAALSDRLQAVDTALAAVKKPGDLPPAVVSERTVATAAATALPDLPAIIPSAKLTDPQQARELAKLRARLEKREQDLDQIRKQPLITENSNLSSLADDSLSAPIDTREAGTHTLRPGDFSRRLVGLTVAAPAAAMPAAALCDLTSVASNYRDAQEELFELKGITARNNPLEAQPVSPGADLPPSENASASTRLNTAAKPQTPVNELRAAFEKTLVRGESKTPEPAGERRPAKRGDLKRLETASEELLSAVAHKKRLSHAPAAPEPGFASQRTKAAIVPPRFDFQTVVDGKLVEAARPETLLFRGNEPARWHANDVERLGDDISYLRLRRLDTGDSVVAPLQKADLRSGTSNIAETWGWSGSGERYLGAAHLGLFDHDLPRDVEVRIGAGGWGFGHSQNGGGEQACAWAGKKIEATAFEISVGTHPIAASDKNADDDGDRWQSAILFCGNAPGLWGQKVYRGERHRAFPLENIPLDSFYLRLRRLDTGESVLIQTSKSEISDDERPQPFGFSTNAGKFYGAHHLGIFDERAADEVETRFTYGGWGFGHSNLTDSAGVQAAGWAGKEIPGDTVFEISVYRDRPPPLEKEVFLGAAPRV